EPTSKIVAEIRIFTLVLGCSNGRGQQRKSGRRWSDCFQVSYLNTLPLKHFSQNLSLFVSRRPLLSWMLALWGSGGESGYRAFISYSHTADRGFAVIVQGTLHRLAKSWYRLRAIRVFLDHAALSANE